MLTLRSAASASDLSHPSAPVPLSASSSHHSQPRPTAASSAPRSPLSDDARPHHAAHPAIILPPSLAALTLRGPHPRKPAPLRTHLVKTALWLLVALLAAACFAFARGRQRALEFVTGYIVEYSLSVDNLFVFLLIFKYFRVPRDAQQTVLFWGILGAMLLRGFMIVAGKALVHRFEWLALAFAALLIYSAAKLLLEDDDDDADLDDNRVIRFSKSLVPVADRYAGARFFVVENGSIMATPLMVVLVAIELSDVVFALDSVPAVLGISNDTFVIYVSNILAVMGLRSLFFVLATSIGNLRFLKQSLSIVLVFIGVKMIAACFGYDFGVAFSLAVVALTLLGGVGLSLALPSPAHSRCSSADLNGLVNNV